MRFSILGPALGSIFGLMFAVVPLLQSAENTGVKMTQRRIFAGNSSEQSFYLLADRKRLESRGSSEYKKPDGTMQWTSGPRVASINRCDLGQTFDLNLDAAEYESAASHSKPWTSEELRARAIKTPAAPTGPPTLRITTSTVDTGERKEFFGHTARHVMITRVQTPLEGSNAQPQETSSDGWYIDFRLQVTCNRNAPSGKRVGSYLSVLSVNQGLERAEFVEIGTPETGYPVQVATSVKGRYKQPDGTVKPFETKYETLVTDLEEGPLAPALFEVPAGFKHVEHIERSPRMLASSSWLGEFWNSLKSVLD